MESLFWGSPFVGTCVCEVVISQHFISFFWSTASIPNKNVSIIYSYVFVT
jgi:hypothetical protein